MPSRSSRIIATTLSTLFLVVVVVVPFRTAAPYPSTSTVTAIISGRSPALNIRNFSNTSTLTIGANNISSQYDGSIYGSVARTAGVDTTINNGAGTLVKVGTGTLTMTGNMQYTGPTNINGGTLRVNGTSP